MEARDGMSACAFNKLFTTNVPYILEKIFFSLDYETFKASREVCRAWKGLISSDAYIKMENKLLTENNERLKKAVKESNYIHMYIFYLASPYHFQF